jgi:N-acetylglucosamine-6-phosphate deacetylase
MVTAFKNATIFTGEEFLEGSTLLTEGEKITGISLPDSIPLGAKEVDCKGSTIAPGFIDLQIGGGGGYFFTDTPTPEAIKAITESIIRTGTTAFLIAMPTSSKIIYQQAVQTVKEYSHPALLGLHLEGPFISQFKAGAHPKQFIIKPHIADIERFFVNAGGVVKMMTIAPEVCTPEDINCIRKYVVTIAAGHSNATFGEALNGFSNGISAVTHLFNAMSPLHHRNPGVPGATYMNQKVYAGIIADGIHVSFDIVSLSKLVMKERLYLVTDAVEESKKGPYLHVRQNDRFTLPEGTLSGSTLTMLKAVKNCVEKIHIPLDESLRMASLYPSRVMKLYDRGLIKESFRADLTIFDRDFNLTGVVIGGNQIKDLGTK